MHGNFSREFSDLIHFICLLRRANLRNDRLNLLEITILLIIQIEEILLALRSLQAKVVTQNGNIL